MTRPFYQSLNQAPRSAKHGKHRRTSPAAHRHPADGASDCTGGSDEDGTFTTLTWTSDRAVDWGAVFARVMSNPEQPTIPHAGIRTGEIIGHRLWWVFEVDGELCLSSLAHHRLWAPDETIKGNTREAVYFDPLWAQVIWGGTYAFADAGPCWAEAKDLAADLLNYANIYFIGSSWWWCGAIAVAIGTIKMWGDVVEHEKGYRAEFAKLNSIDDLYGQCDLAALRRRYELTQPTQTDAS